jgi:DNA-directed RNA polymerase subunit RPC12/RpoP
VTGPLDLRCHACGHSWQEAADFAQRVSRLLIRLMTVRCPHCGTGASGLGFGRAHRHG